MISRNLGVSTHSKWPPKSYGVLCVLWVEHHGLQEYRGVHAFDVPSMKIRRRNWRSFYHRTIDPMQCTRFRSENPTNALGPLSNNVFGSSRWRSVVVFQHMPWRYDRNIETNRASSLAANREKWDITIVEITRFSINRPKYRERVLCLYFSSIPLPSLQRPSPTLSLTAERTYHKLFVITSRNGKYVFGVWYPLHIFWGVLVHVMALLGISYCTELNAHNQVTETHIEVSCVIQLFPMCRRQRHRQNIAVTAESRGQLDGDGRATQNIAAIHGGTAYRFVTFTCCREKAEMGSLPAFPPPVLAVDDDIKTQGFAMLGRVALRIVYSCIFFLQRQGRTVLQMCEQSEQRSKSQKTLLANTNDSEYQHRRASSHARCRQPLVSFGFPD